MVTGVLFISESTLWQAVALTEMRETLDTKNSAEPGENVKWDTFTEVAKSDLSAVPFSNRKGTVSI